MKKRKSIFKGSFNNILPFSRLRSNTYILNNQEKIKKEKDRKDKKWKLTVNTGKKPSFKRY